MCLESRFSTRLPGFVGWNWAHKTPDTNDQVAERNLFNFNVLLVVYTKKPVLAMIGLPISMVRQQHTIRWRSDLGHNDDNNDDDNDNDNDDNVNDNDDNGN